MNNMILHLIRHPKPRIANGICYGRLDLLAENSAVVADKLQLELPAGLPLWSSPLLRCRALAECLHPQPMFDERLAEMNFGEWEGRPWDDIPRAQLDAWAADVAGYIPPGGESALALQHRALSFIAGLNASEAVIVTHAGVIRTLLAHWRGLPAERWTELVFPYASCTRVEVHR